MTAEASNNLAAKIGRYRITGELGRGGMGIVYQGEDRLIGRRVAIKTLTEVTPELRERFYLEARSGILSHPNIVTVYEVGEHEESPFIAMEFIEGDSLEKLLREQKRLSLLEALSIVEQICAGLGYAHGHGVVHRDVKPANILVRPDGRVTIVDFGIARLADQTRQLTKTDTLLGTFHYIAPERLKGEPSDGKADIWSVGVMLYELLTGQLPFKGRDVSALYRVIHEPYVPLAEHIQDIPDELNRVLDKALAKQLDARYATAEEMAFDIHALAQGLKHDRVGSLLETARRLTDQSQFASARTVLLQAQRIDPTSSDAKALLSDVQDRLSQLHRSEQLRQIIDQVQEAEGGRRWSDAIALLQQAKKLDTENAFNLEERFQTAQDKKRRQQKVLDLWKHADEARHLGDLTGAQGYLNQALQIDSRNTELRNAYSDLLRELKSHTQKIRFDELSPGARDEDARQSQAEVIPPHHKADKIDPVHPNALNLPTSLATLQNQEPGQNVDLTKRNAQEPTDNNPSSVEDDATSLLETLPSDGSSGHLSSKLEDKKQVKDIDQEVTTLVSNREFIASVDGGTDSTKLLQLPQQAQDSTQGKNNLTLPLSELVIKTQLVEAPSIRPDASIESHVKQGDSIANAAKEEIQVATKTAIVACNRAIAAGNLADCMRSLDELEVRHPGEYEVSAARKECESARRKRATRLLQEAIRDAKRHSASNSTKRAEEALKKVEYARPYADLDVRSDWERLRSKYDASLRPRSAPSTIELSAAGGKSRQYATTLSIAAILLVVGATFYRRHVTHLHADSVTGNRSTPMPLASVAISTDMEINASPWAKVLSVQRKSGKRMILPNEDVTTPLRLEAVDSGVYEITVAGPDNKQQTTECSVSPTDHLCFVDIASPDIKQLLTGGQ